MEMGLKRKKDARDKRGARLCMKSFFEFEFEFLSCGALNEVQR